MEFFWNETLYIRVNNDSNIDLMISNFYKKVHSITEICAPLKPSYTLVDPTWNSKQLSRLKNRKNKKLQEIPKFWLHY